MARFLDLITLARDCSIEGLTSLKNLLDEAVPFLSHFLELLGSVAYRLKGKSDTVVQIKKGFNSV